MSNTITIAIPKGVEEARIISARVDAVLLGGFGRLGKSENAALESLVASVAESPIGAALSAAVQGLQSGELLAHHMAVVAAARASLEGARHDALFAAATEALGLVVDTTSAEVAHAISAEARQLMDGARQWLVEIALAGLGQLQSAAIAPAVAGLRSLQEHGELTRLSALLAGFANELLECAPTNTVESPPARRWSDLWCQAMLSTYSLPARPQSSQVSGTLFPLGADIRHHDNLLSVVVHSLLKVGDERRLVRTTLSSWKVDAVYGDELWRLLTPLAPELLDALVKPKTLQLSNATLLASGDLLWGGDCVVGKAFSPWELDLTGAIVSAVLPRDRHPLAIALPIISSDPDVLSSLNPHAVSPHANLSEKELQNATSAIGVLRFDAAFSVQPLAVLRGKKSYGPAEGVTAAAKVKSPALDILRERASKLLRA